MATEAVNAISVLEVGEEVSEEAGVTPREKESSPDDGVEGVGIEMDKLDVEKKGSMDSGSICYSGTNLTREHSFVFYRGRAKSLDGGIIYSPQARTSESSIIPKLTSFWNSFAYGSIMAALRKLRMKFQERENKKWNAVTGFVKKVVSSIFFKVLMLLVVLSQSILLCFYKPEVKGDIQVFNQYVYYATIGYLLFYIIEALLNITAYGLLLNPRKSFLRRPIYMLDLLIIVLGIIYLSLRGIKPEIAEVFSSLMALKMLKILALLSNRVRFMLKVLAKSVRPLFHLGVLTFVVVLFFAIMGIELFQGKLHGGCYANYTTPAGNNRSILVSEFPCPMDNTSLPGTHQCPPPGQCMTWELGPHQGLVSFDNILLGILVVFQCITLEGWSAVFYLYESSVGYTYAWVYFVAVILVGSILILNLLVGVLTNVFIGVSDREELKGNSRRNKAKKRIENDLHNYNEWLKKGAELLQPYDVTGSIERLPTSTPNDMSSSEDDDEDEDANPQLAAENGTARRCGWYYHSSRKLKVLVRSKVWFWMNIMAHAINLIFLMTFHFPSQTPAYESGVYILNFIFSCLYVIDTFLTVYAMGPIGFFKRKKIYAILFNTGEVFLALLSIIGIFSDWWTEFHLLVLVNAVWSLKLVLAGKISRKSWKHLKEVLGTFGQLITSVASILYINALIMFIFTIIGLRLFGNRLDLTSNSQQPNFDSFWNSFFLVFQLWTSEDWHNILYATSTAISFQDSILTGYLTSVYFLIVIFIGSIILVTVLLALVVDKLSEVRASEEDQEKEREELQKERKLRSEQLSALRGPEKNVQRRTIRRLIRFHAHNPAERARALRKEENKNYWRQSSLPQLPHKLMKNFTLSNLEFHRASSIPPESPAARSERERTLGQKLDVIEEEKDTVDVHRTWSHERHWGTRSVDSAGKRPIMPASSKKVNPLRLMKEPSTFIDEQKLRMMGRAAENPVTHTAQSRRARRIKANKKKGEKSRKERTTEARLETMVVLHDHGDTSLSDRQLSAYGSPSQELKVIEEEKLEEETPEAELPSEKAEVSPNEAVPPLTQQGDSAGDGSRPRADSSLSTHSHGRQIISRQSNMDMEDEEGSVEMLELEEADEDEEHDQQSATTTTRLSYAASLEVQTPQHYTRGSSLEPINPWKDQRRHSDGRIRKSTKELILSKLSKAWKWMRMYFGSFQYDPSQELAKIPPHSAFFAIDHESNFRQFCFAVVRSRPFQTISYAVVILSSILLMLEIPNGNADSPLCSIQNNIIWVDVGLIIFFAVEMVLKMISLGVFLHRDSYLRGLFNILDFLILILNVIPIIVYFSNYNRRTKCVSYGFDPILSPAIGLLRVSRVLRPLRAFRIGGLRLVVTAIVSSIKATLIISFIDGLFIIIFAVIGINYFRGAFYYCTDPNIITEDMCRGFYFKYDYSFGSNSSIPGLACPEALERMWEKRNLNFDNIGNAILTLFTMLTAEGWENVMYNGINHQDRMDSTRALGPMLENSLASSLYFLLYMIVMTFILLQLFVGFVIITFQEVGVTSYRETRLNRNQRHCLHFALTTKPTRQWSPRYKIQRRLRKYLLPIIKSYIAKVVIFMALLINVIVLAIRVYNREFNVYLNHINDAFTVFFLLEAIIRLIILTPPIYFRSVWNTFEFLIAVGSSIELFIFCWVRGHHSHIVTTFRVLRLLRFYPAVRRILWTVINSLEVFPWVGYLLVIVVFIYSVLGMHLFGNIKLESIDIAEERGRGIHVYNNFATFPSALLVMIRVITGENWPDVMLSSVAGQTCEPLLGGSNTSISGVNCGNNLAYIFYPSFYIISTIMILNLFVAIIIDNFDYVIRDKSILGAYDLKQFVTLWYKIDKETRGTLTPNEVVGLFRKINPPVGWGKLCPQILAYKKMMRLNIPITKVQESVEGSTETREVKKVTFNATLFALVKNVLQIGCSGCSECSRKCNKELRERLIKCFPTMEQKLIDNVLAKEEDETVASEYAVLMVQAEWRSFMMRRRKLIETFHGSEGGTLKVHRIIPDPGPDPRQRRTSHFFHDLEHEHPIAPRKISETSSIFSDRSRESSRSPMNLKTISSPINSRVFSDESFVDDRFKRSFSPLPASTHYPRPLSPNLEVPLPRKNSSTNRPSQIPLDRRPSKEGIKFTVRETPGGTVKWLPSDEEEQDELVAESPIWTKKSEADTVSFTSAYSQLHESLESFEIPETTV